ncbi:MAG: Mu transposase domain-containing protein [Acidimicrobiia bacterium]
MVGRRVIRKVDSPGNISFAGTSYRVGNAYRRQQVEVAVVGDTVEISAGSRLIRTHPTKHNPDRAHGAFANPGGRAKRINAAFLTRGGVSCVGTGANLSCGYRDLTGTRRWCNSSHSPKTIHVPPRAAPPEPDGRRISMPVPGSRGTSAGLRFADDPVAPTVLNTRRRAGHAA